MPAVKLCSEPWLPLIGVTQPYRAGTINVMPKSITHNLEHRAWTCQIIPLWAPRAFFWRGELLKAKHPIAQRKEIGNKTGKCVEYNEYLHLMNSFTCPVQAFTFCQPFALKQKDAVGIEHQSSAVPDSIFAYRASDEDPQPVMTHKEVNTDPGRLQMLLLASLQHAWSCMD